MPRPLGALIVEDSENDAILVVRELRRGGYDVTFERVDTAPAMQAALCRKKWDVIIADYQMPHFSGLGALEVLKDSGLDLPFIIVSGAIGEDLAVEAMRRGAHDYVMKGKLTRLVPAVERELGEAEVRQQRRLAEESLRTAHEELEQRVKERTLELAEANQELARHREHLEELVEQRTRELRMAQEELVNKERLAVLGQLVGMVSHELRNPLSVTRTSLFSIGERLRGLGPELQRSLERAERGIQRCDLIIEELLDFTRAAQPHRTQTAIDDWLAEVLDDQTIPPGVSLRRDLASGLTISLDPERMRRCAINLLTNAYHAIQEARRTDGCVTVTARREDERLVIAIADNGAGIAPEALSKVFKPLYTTRAFGIGLGLCVVNQVITQHGGGVDIRSTVGEGTTVTLWLPLTHREKESVRLASAPPLPAGKPQGEESTWAVSSGPAQQPPT